MTHHRQPTAKTTTPPPAHLNTAHLDKTPHFVGALLASAIIGIVLGGAIAIVTGHFADSTTLPSEEQISISKSNALLGSVHYGQRITNNP